MWNFDNLWKHGLLSPGTLAWEFPHASFSHSENNIDKTTQSVTEQCGCHSVTPFWNSEASNNSFTKLKLFPGSNVFLGVCYGMTNVVNHAHIPGLLRDELKRKDNIWAYVKSYQCLWCPKGFSKPLFMMLPPQQNKAELPFRAALPFQDPWHEPSDASRKRPQQQLREHTAPCLVRARELAQKKTLPPPRDFGEMLIDEFATGSSSASKETLSWNHDMVHMGLSHDRVLSSKLHFSMGPETIW